MPMALMAIVPLLLTDDYEWKALSFLLYLFLVWGNDVFAYLVGVTMGRHKMCERLSPKKSWEGFVGGVVGAIGIAVLMGYIFDGNLYLWGGLGLIVALTGVAGDLVESMLKRSAEMKDSGAIIPGHGGVLDRFDALLLSTPFAFIYLIILKNLIQM
jgi:phosphatidate cytidylyltransferase